MKDERKTLYLPYVFIGLFIAIFLLPLISFPEYSIIANTTSHLGSQGAPYNWVVNSIFIIVGVMVIMDGNYAFKHLYFQRVCMIVFGIGLIGSGLFPHRSLLDGSSNLTLDYLHTLFSTLSVVTFAILAFSFIFVFEDKRLRWLAGAMFLVVIIAPTLMLYIGSVQGIVQRIMMLFGFVWLMLMHEYFKREADK